MSVMSGKPPYWSFGMPADAREDRRCSLREMEAEPLACDLCGVLQEDLIWRCTFPGGITLPIHNGPPEHFTYWFLCPTCYPQLETFVVLGALAGGGG
jgi:hypothetical protein